MDDGSLNDDIWDVKFTAEKLKTTPRTISSLIANGEIRGRKIGKGYITTKSAVLDYINASLQTDTASAGDHKGESPWQSPNVMGSGTVISLHRQEKELDKALERGTKSKRRSCMTS